MTRNISKIKASTPVVPARIPTAGYARVSSGKDAMLHSLSQQVSYYSDYIQRHGNWDYFGVYTDEALTGTKDTVALEAERDELQSEMTIVAEMMEKCIADNAHRRQDQDEYNRRYGGLADRFENAKARFT